jgi:hypothetical protein
MIQNIINFLYYAYLDYMCKQHPRALEITVSQNEKTNNKTKNNNDNLICKYPTVGGGRFSFQLIPLPFRITD